MKRKDLWKLSLLNVFSLPLRSLLTVLGIAIGIGAVLAVLTLGEAGKTQVRAEMTRLGINRVWLTASEGGKLLEGDSVLLRETLQTEATEQIFLITEIRSGGQKWTAPVVGCSEEYMRLCGVRVVDGRMLYPLEWSEKGKGVLVGARTAKALSVKPGDELEVAGMVFRVCGIVKADGAFSRVDAQEAVFLPLKVLSPRTGSSVHEIMLSIPSGMSPQSAAEFAQQTMKHRRNLTVDATKRRAILGSNEVRSYAPRSNFSSLNLKVMNQEFIQIVRSRNHCIFKSRFI